MSNDTSPLMSIVSFGSIDEKEFANTFGLLFPEKMLQSRVNNETVFRCNGRPNTLMIRKGLLVSTQEPPILLHKDFAIELIADDPSLPPAPPVIIKGGGFSDTDNQFTVTVQNQSSDPLRQVRPIQPFADEYITTGDLPYTVCLVSPGGSENVLINISVESGFFILLEGQIV